MYLTETVAKADAVTVLCFCCNPSATTVFIKNLLEIQENKHKEKPR